MPAMSATPRRVPTETTNPLPRKLNGSGDAACEAADWQAQALALEGLASTASLREDPRTAGKLLGAAAALREGNVVTAAGAHLAQCGSALGHLDRVYIDRTIARVGGRPAYDSAYAEGLHDPQAVLNAVRA
jgi:hypothetical protein